MLKLVNTEIILNYFIYYIYISVAQITVYNVLDGLLVVTNPQSSAKHFSIFQLFVLFCFF